MKYNQFVKSAERTQSDEIFLDELSSGSVMRTLKNFIHKGNELDLLKKATFYGGERIQKFNAQSSTDQASDYLSLNSVVEPTIMHGILGIASEAVELVEALQKSLDSGEEIDLINLKEEIGDLLWYMTLIVKSEAELYSIFDTNIAKLQSRYPEKFTEFKATHRDLKKERAILSAPLLKTTPTDSSDVELKVELKMGGFH